MHFTTLALSAMASGTLAAVTVHVVQVGGANGALEFSPNNIVAAVGDGVQFHFQRGTNHTVTQSVFDSPCQPIASHSAVTGVFSGFMPVSADATEAPTYTIIINNTTPMWLYCSQKKHCQNGMTMVINENTKANASRSLEAYQALAKTQTANLAPGTPPTNGTSGEASASEGGASGSSSGSSSSSSSGSSPSDSSKSNSTSSSSENSGTRNSAASLRATEALTLGGLLAVGMALFT